MLCRIAIPPVAGTTVVLCLALAGTAAFAQPGHFMSHLGHEHTNHYGTAYPPYWRGSFSYPSYHYTPYYGYRVYQYGSYGGTHAYRPLNDLSLAFPANPLPRAGVGGARFTVINPPESGGTLRFSLGGQVYTLEPGSQKEFRLSPLPIIEFDRGGAFGRARYTLGDGIYTFTPTDRGWELYHSKTMPGPTAP